MDIILGQRMRELREQRKNTQEQLAVHIGVTTQAVSKWERGEGFPDIATLPVIASFYNVTVDSLLGVDNAVRKRKLSEYEQRSKKIRGTDAVSERIALWREAYREFPNEPVVLHNLSFALGRQGFEKHSEEIILLAKRLLEESTQSGEYFGAIRNLCFAYKSIGDINEAKRYASMAGRYIGTENQLMIHLLEGDDAAGFCQWNIETLVDLISTNAAVMLQKGTFSNEEKIHIAEQILQLFAVVYDDGCYGFYHCRISKWYMRLAKWYAQVEDQSKTLYCLKNAVQHAVAYDTLKEGSYTALIMNRLQHQASENSERLLPARKKEMTDSCFAFVKENPVFKQLYL